MFLVTDDIEEGEKSDYIRIVANVAAGAPGERGTFGSGGANGNGRPKINVGSCGQPQNQDGRNGAMGAQGLGPSKRDSSEDFVIIDVVSPATFVASMASPELHRQTRRPRISAAQPYCTRGGSGCPFVMIARTHS